MNCNDLTILLHSNICLLVIETFDETRALSLLARYFREQGRSCWRWTVSEGKQPLGFGLLNEADGKCREPEEILQHIKKLQTASAFVLCDLHPYLDDPKIIRLLKDIALNQQAAKHQVVLVSHRFSLPAEISRYAASVPMSLPSEDEILAIIREEAKAWVTPMTGNASKPTAHRCRNWSITSKACPIKTCDGSPAVLSSMTAPSQTVIYRRSVALNSR